MKVIPPLTIGEGGEFARASNATYFDRQGVLRTAGYDTPRFSYDMASPAEGPVLLIENSATNLLSYSESPVETTGYGGGVTTATTSIVGFTNSLQFTGDGVTKYAYLSHATVVGEEYAFSVFVQMDDGEAPVVAVGNAPGDPGDFMVVVQSDAWTSPSEVAYCGGGVYRIKTVFTATGAGTNYGLAKYGTLSNRGMRVTGHQLELGTQVTSYVKTGAEPATREADVVTGTGLVYSTAIEEATGAWSTSLTYAYGDVLYEAGAAGLRTMYQSIRDNNLGRSPATSPGWWEPLGTTYQTYSSDTTYALGDRVVDLVGHKVYESALAGNVGQALTNDTKWVLVGPTNRWGIFDLLRNTATVQPYTTSVIFKPGERIDSLALLGMKGDWVTVQVFVGTEEVYRASGSLTHRDVLDWYDYWYAPVLDVESLVKFDVPPYSGAFIAVTAFASLGDAQIGACAVGLQQYVGAVQYDAESDVLNFSSVERDFDGETSRMIPRRSVPKTGQQLQLDKSLVNRVRALRRDLGGRPAVWSGLDDDNGNEYFEALLILGFYKKFSINLKAPAFALIGLDLEEI